jgi:hypothetical protein
MMVPPSKPDNSNEGRDKDREYCERHNLFYNSSQSCYRCAIEAEQRDGDR